MNNAPYDAVFLGGGLASCLTAWRLRARHPGIRLCVLERDAALGGIHTWSFHDTDLTAEERRWIEPLVVYRWPAQTVRFPGYERTLKMGYNTITAERFHAVMTRELDGIVRLGAEVADTSGGTVTLADGSELRAGVVLDGRGPQATDALATGFQTFVGHEIEFARPHGVECPTIMDATVEQLDGYRFVYLLPFGPTRMLVEDTYYNNHPRLDVECLRARIASYVDARGWQVAELVREETGVLPIVMAGDVEALGAGANGDGAVPIGMRAGLFHAVTGYSLPLAVRLADSLAALVDLDAPRVRRHVRDAARANWREQAYFRLLTRMLFLAADAGGRRAIFERFYGLSEPLIQRFYAGRLRSSDKLRILVGKPPVPVAAAVRVLTESAAWRQ